MSREPAPLSQPSPSCIVWDDSLLAYDFGPGHPMDPGRLELSARLARDTGIFAAPGVTRAQPFMAADHELAAIHTPAYIAAVRQAGEDPASADASLGLGTEDNPAFAGMHQAAARLVGGSLAAADAVLSGQAVHAVNFSGGMHHAAPGRASGFCIYNDAAAAVQRLLDSGVERVLYVDVDAHHGDGTQGIFWDEPRVMTISLHETGMSLFPGTGFANETGGGNAEGYAVNIALPTAAGDAQALRAFHAVVPQLAAAFRPDVVVSQHGCDSHDRDPLTNLRYSIDGQHQLALAIRELAVRFCEGRWVATGGGGYDISDVVPRSFALLTAVVAGAQVGPATPVPEPWRRYVAGRYGTVPPRWMGDGAEPAWRPWDAGYDPDDALDRTVMATRRAVFPMHGLDPWFD
jgi:acetoin utilization protein AcuC